MKFTLALGLLAAVSPALATHFPHSGIGQAATLAVGASSAMTMAVLGLWLGCLYLASLLVESPLGRWTGLRVEGAV